MRALVLTDFHQLDVVDRPRPVPGDGEVLLRIAATGICGSDFHGFTGENGRRVPGQIMGHESAGTIAELGSGVDPETLPLGAPATFNPLILPAVDVEAFRGREQHCPRKRVVGVAHDYQSSFANYVVMPARNVRLLDPALPLHFGALIEPLAVAVHAARVGDAGPAKGVLVIGGGPIGQSVILALRMLGVTDIVLSEPSAARRNLCARLGATVIDPEGGEIRTQVEAALGGTADLAIDAVGISPTMRDALAATGLGGTVVLVGMGSPTLEIPAFAVSTEERTIRGSFTYTAQDFADASDWIGENAAAAEPLVSEMVGPDRAHEAFTRLAAGDGPPGKVLVDFTTEGRP